MEPFPVMQLYVFANRAFSKADRVAVLQTDSPVLDPAPDSSDEHVFTLAATTIHPQLERPRQQRLGDIGRRERVDAIGVQDVGQPIARKAVVEYLNSVCCFPRDDDPVRDYLGTHVVHHCGQKVEAPHHWSGRDVECPSPLGLFDLRAARQIPLDSMLSVAAARFRAGVRRLDAYAPRQRALAAATNVMNFQMQRVDQHLRFGELKLHVQFADSSHQRLIRVAHRGRALGRARSGGVDQRRRARNWQRTRTVVQRVAPGNPTFVSSQPRKSFFRVNPRSAFTCARSPFEGAPASRNTSAVRSCGCRFEPVISFGLRSNCCASCTSFGSPLPVVGAAHVLIANEHACRVFVVNLSDSFGSLAVFSGPGRSVCPTGQISAAVTQLLSIQSKSVMYVITFQGRKTSNG